MEQTGRYHQMVRQYGAGDIQAVGRQRHRVFSGMNNEIGDLLGRFYVS